MKSRDRRRWEPVDDCTSGVDEGEGIDGTIGEVAALFGIPKYKKRAAY